MSKIRAWIASALLSAALWCWLRGFDLRYSGVRFWPGFWFTVGNVISPWLPDDFVSTEDELLGALFERQMRLDGRELQSYLAGIDD